MSVITDNTIHLEFSRFESYLKDKGLKVSHGREAAHTRAIDRMGMKDAKGHQPGGMT